MPLERTRVYVLLLGASIVTARSPPAQDPGTISNLKFCERAIVRRLSRRMGLEAHCADSRKTCSSLVSTVHDEMS
jgi:hypothetical protein